jgi:DNA-binding LacI/PurR family transcriptional regulator
MQSMAGPLYEQIYAYLREEIHQGRLSNGDRVPSEKELAEQFHVSRITSKKSLDMLVQDGLIERVQGKGSFVAANLADHKPSPRSINGETHLIGIILPDFSESFGQRILLAVEKTCSENGYLLTLAMTQDQREAEVHAIKTMIQSGAQGLIVLPIHGEYYNDLLVRLALDHFPLVIIDRPMRGVSACAVHSDNKRASAELTRFLIDQGYQNIAFLSPPPENTTTIEERIAGFAETLSQSGRAYFLTNLFSTLPNCFIPEKIQADQQTMRLFLEQYPAIQAFVVCEYNIALMLKDVLMKMGKRIPEDYAIVCFDSPSLPVGEPQFTHIQQNEIEIGQVAVNLLLSQIHGDPVTNPVVAVEHRLVKGLSTLP